jgi:hypothetical protein
VIHPRSVRYFPRGSISETPAWYRAAENKRSWSRTHERNRPGKRTPRTPPAKFFPRV